MLGLARSARTRWLTRAMTTGSVTIVAVLANAGTSWAGAQQSGTIALQPGTISVLGDGSGGFYTLSPNYGITHWNSMNQAGTPFGQTYTSGNHDTNLVLFGGNIGFCGNQPSGGYGFCAWFTTGGNYVSSHTAGSSVNFGGATVANGILYVSDTKNDLVDSTPDGITFTPHTVPSMMSPAGILYDSAGFLIDQQNGVLHTDANLSNGMFVAFGGTSEATVGGTVWGSRVVTTTPTHVWFTNPDGSNPQLLSGFSATGLGFPGVVGNDLLVPSTSGTAYWFAPQAAPQPGASLSPTTLNFGNVTDGTKSAAQTVTLTATNGAVNVTSLYYSNPVFTTTNDNCSGKTVPAGGTCTFGVTAAPTSLGAHSGEVDVNDNASGSPQKVQVSVTGVAPSTGPTCSSSAADFSGFTFGHASQTCPNAQCSCLKLKAFLNHFSVSQGGKRIDFRLNWVLTCSAGTGKCKGQIAILAPRGFEFSVASSASKRSATVSCAGDCNKTTKGHAKLTWEPAPLDRAGMHVKVKVRITCFNSPAGGLPKVTRETLTMVFNDRGQIDYAESDLNGDGKPDRHQLKS